MKLRVLPLLIALLLVQVVNVQAEPSPTTLTFEVYTDGTVKTGYSLEVDPTNAQVNITIFGEHVQDLFVYDENGILLGTELIGDYLQVDTLGASSIDLSYLTSDLTRKQGAIWSITVETPISTEVTLPLSSTIINLNEIPLEIVVVEDQTKLVMPAGSIAVSYTIDIQDSEDYTEQEINDAQTELDAAKDNGIIVSLGEEKLEEAIIAYQSEDYLMAQEKAAEARVIIAETIQMASDANNEVFDAQQAILLAESQGRTISLEQVKDMLDEAITLVETGSYAEAVDKAKEVTNAAQVLEAPPKPGNNPTLIIGVLAAVLVAGYIGFRLRKEPVDEPKEMEIDLERLFLEHQELRLDDKEALRYMSEHGGEAFAHEVRDRLDIPRTSAWRMVQRLQRFEVIEERKVGGQSLLSIVDEYRRQKQ